MNYKEFIEQILEDKEYLNEDAQFYVRKHARRFFYTYKKCLALLKPGDKVLSIGGFHCSIEKMLKKAIDIEVVVTDYPESIKMQKKYYDFLNFRYKGIDLAQGLEGMEQNYYNLVIYTEVIEHIPLPPYEQLQPFDPLLKKGGHILITTPNLSSIVHIAKLIMKIPHYDTPDKFFSSISKENLQVHRREYMPQEIIEAFDKMNYTNELYYFIYNEPKSIQYRLMYIIGNIIPRFREGMLIVGTKIKDGLISTI